ncbi:hypothetical protein PENFLA_c005G00313 [Penicillium flavigenum]|nr:hypothetical protein PENFLA_c005G00313 [Penicillium flavigenum]
MKYLAAYLLLALAGNEAPSAADIKDVLSSVGIDAEADRLEKVIAELQGKDLQELIAEGSTKLASVPSGGGAAAAPAAAAAGGAEAAAEEKKEEKVEEESDEDMGFGLFD